MAHESVSRFPELRIQELRQRVAALNCELVDKRESDDRFLGDAIIIEPDRRELRMELSDVDAWCSGRQAAKEQVPADAQAWLAGADIAIDLLEEGADVGLDQMAMQDDCRCGRPQSNVFLKHLRRLRELNNPTSDIGFSAVMTEYVALYADGLSMQALIDDSREPFATTANVPTGVAT